jgi:hypothetical protein
MKCDVCDEEFANSEALKAHMEREHPVGDDKETDLDNGDVAKEGMEPEPIVVPPSR